MLLTACMMPAMSVSANTQKVDIADYTPVMPQGINIGTIYATSVSVISL